MTDDPNCNVEECDELIMPVIYAYSTIGDGLRVGH